MNLHDSTLEAIIRNYCRESGVRSLEQHIEKIARKLALQAVSKNEGVDVVSKDSNIDKSLESITSVDTSSDPPKITFELTEMNLPIVIGKARFPQVTLIVSLKYLLTSAGNNIWW